MNNRSPHDRSSSRRRRDAAMFEYRVTWSGRGFAAHCPEMRLSTEGATVADAVVALRSAIDRHNRF